MVGAVIVVLAMLFVLPVGLFVAGALWSAWIGGALEADRRSAGGAAATDG
jgi:hypothetical protein